MFLEEFIQTMNNIINVLISKICSTNIISTTSVVNEFSILLLLGLFLLFFVVENITKYIKTNDLWEITKQCIIMIISM